MARGKWHMVSSICANGAPYSSLSDRQITELKEDYPECDNPQDHRWMRDPDMIDSKPQLETKPIENLQEWISGRTVIHVDTSSVNCLTITFRDGPKLFLDTEAQGYGIYGPVPYEITKE